jgi:hypothetical protein
VPDAVELGEDGEVLAHGQALRQLDIGRAEVHPRQHAVAVLQDVDAEDPRLARGGQQHAEENGERRRLAGAVAAQERRDRARRHGEGEVFDRRHLAEALDEMRDLDGGGHGLVRRRGPVPVPRVPRARGMGAAPRAFRYSRDAIPMDRAP